MDFLSKINANAGIDVKKGQFVAENANVTNFEVRDAISKCATTTISSAKASFNNSEFAVYAGSAVSVHAGNCCASKLNMCNGELNLEASGNSIKMNAEFLEFCSPLSPMNIKFVPAYGINIIDSEGCISKLSFNTEFFKLHYGEPSSNKYAGPAFEITSKLSNSYSDVQDDSLPTAEIKSQRLDISAYSKNDNDFPASITLRVTPTQFIIMAEPTLDKLTFTLSSDGTYYTVKSATSVTGEVVIPDTYNGLPVTEIEAGGFEFKAGITSVQLPNSIIKIGNDAFCGCAALTSINIPSNVTEIGAAAFNSCTSLTSITISDSVTTIGNAAFYGCTNLASVVLSNNLSDIKANAFANCTALTAITIPDGVTDICASTFANCSALTQINIGTGVTSIHGNAFQNCTSLTSITLPDNVVSLYGPVFIGCSSLSNVNLSNNLKTISSGAFSYCTSLTSIVIPDSVTELVSDVFKCCINLASVTLSDNLTYIGANTFSNCTSLTSIDIPDSVTTIGSNTFNECSALTSVVIEGTPTVDSTAFNNTPNLEKITVYADKGYSTSVAIGGKQIEIAPTLDKLTFTLSGYGTYYSVKALDTTITGEVVIPSEYEGKSVKEIEINAFNGCSALTSVNIPDGVTSIGNHAFNECSALTSINIPNSVNSIGEWTFCSCYALTSITIPNSVTSIGIWAFSACNALKSVTIGNGVMTIRNSTFNGCWALTSITIPDSVTTIEERAFNNCRTLRYVTIGNSVTSIGYGAFNECWALASIVIPDNVTSIGERAFYDCTSLTSITIGNGTTSIGNYAFSRCSALTIITVDPENTTYKSDGNCLIEKNTNKIILGCKTSIIPNYVTSIGIAAFSGSALTSVAIPEGVTSIEGYVFVYCSDLTNVIIKGKPTVSSNAFNDTQKLEKIYVIEDKGYSASDKIATKPVEIISEARALELEKEWFSSFIAYIGTTPITAIYLGNVNISNIL